MVVPLASQPSSMPSARGEADEVGPHLGIVPETIAGIVVLSGTFPLLMC